MIHHVQLSRPIIWRLDDEWSPVDLPAFGLRLLSIWTHAEENSEYAFGSQVFKTNAGWTLVTSRSLQFEGDVEQHRYLELFAQLAQRLRWASGQASLARTFLSWATDTESTYSVLRLPQAQPVGRGWFNRSFYAAPLTVQQCVEAGRATSVESPFLLLADAAEARADGDAVRAILYSALAAETCSHTRVRQLGERVLQNPEPHFRVAAVDGQPRDEVLSALMESGRRNADTLLHELPIYLERRSLKRDLPSLWRQWKRLKASRNKLAHEGDFEIRGEEHLPATGAGAVEALKTAIEIFEWWGLPARRFFEATADLTNSDAAPGFFTP